jgi:hypothetical protein
MRLTSAPNFKLCAPRTRERRVTKLVCVFHTLDGNLCGIARRRKSLHTDVGVTEISRLRWGIIHSPELIDIRFVILLEDVPGRAAESCKGWAT